MWKSHQPFDQPFELSNLEKSCELKSPPKTGADEDGIPVNHNESSDTQSNDDKSNALKRAMAEIDRLFPVAPAGESSLHNDNTTVHQSNLEEELVSSIHPDASSLLMPDLHDENNLKEAATSVNDECGNLIVACNSPDEDVADAMADVSEPKVSVMSLGKGSERVGGILEEPDYQEEARSRKSHIVFATLIVPAIGIGLYAYLNPQNAMQIAQLPKLDLPVMQQISAVGDFLSMDKTTANNNSDEILQRKQVQPAKLTKLTGIPVRSSTYGLARSNIEFAKDTRRANDQREPVLSVGTGKDNARLTSTVVNNIVSTSSRDISVLPERFDQGMSPETKQKTVRKLSDQAVQQPKKVEPVVTPQLVQKPVRKSGFSTGRRDLQSVQRVVLSANVGEVLDGAQLKTFINGLAEGECVSEALQGVVGENKISPVFVRSLMKNIDSRC